jgi:branched-chain amino acid transport system ATP-binding protein
MSYYPVQIVITWSQFEIHEGGGLFSPDISGLVESVLMELKLRGVSKQFGGVTALDDVDLDVSTGEIIGLIGPNGAGKTTLINVVSGFIRPDSGSVHLGEVSLGGMRPQQVAHAGIARTFQNIRLFKRLTVAQNIEVAQRTRPNKSSRLDATSEVNFLLETFGLETMASREAGTLPYGQQRLLEIARAVATKPHFLLLDEPAAGANEAESQEMIRTVGSLRDVISVGLLIIDHDLRFILGISERIYVLDGGRPIATGTPEQITNDPKVIEIYLGRKGTAA